MGHKQKTVFNVDESMEGVAKLQATTSKRSKGSESRFYSNTMQPRSARGDSKAIVAQSAVGGARRAFELDPTLNPAGVRSLVIHSNLCMCLEPRSARGDFKA